MSNSLELKGQSAVVTGGATGIGRAIATVLAAHGANVALVSRAPERAPLAPAGAGGGRVLALAADVRVKADVTRAVAAAAAAFGTIDILVNNAGLGIAGPVLAFAEADWDTVIDTNLKGTFLVTQAVLPHMLERRSGYVVTIASQAGLHGYADAAPYCAAKHGVIGFSAALQKEVRDRGVHVHCLCPALVQVPAPAAGAAPQGGVLQVDDVARTVLFLVTQPRHVTFANIGLYHAGWWPD